MSKASGKGLWWLLNIFVVVIFPHVIFGQAQIPDADYRTDDWIKLIKERLAVDSNMYIVDEIYPGNNAHYIPGMRISIVDTTIRADSIHTRISLLSGMKDKFKLKVEHLLPNGKIIFTYNKDYFDPKKEEAYPIVICDLSGIIDTLIPIPNPGTIRVISICSTK